MTLIRSLFGLVLVAAAAHTSVHANGTRLPSQDAEIVARGNAGVAGVNSSAALHYNPAGLAQVARPEIRAGAYFVSPKTEFTSAATGRTIEERSEGFVQPHLYAALPLRGNVTVGAGVYTPYGESTDWPTDSGFGGLATFNEIIYVTGALAVAWRPTPALAIGAALQFSQVDVDLNRLAAAAPGVISRFQFTGGDEALSGNVGVQWQIAPDHRLGLLYQRKTDFDVQGTATLIGALSRPGEVGWVFPDHLTIGWQWTITPQWLAEVAVDWTNWERVNALALNAGPLSTTVPLHWKSSAYYGFGLTRRVDNHWSWSAGYIFSENSVPDATLTPSLPDVDRHLLTAGIGWEGARWKFFATLQQGLRSSRTKAAPAPDGLGGSAAGTYYNQIFSGALQATARF